MAVNEDQSADMAPTQAAATGAAMPQEGQGAFRPRRRRRITLTLQKNGEGYVLRAPGGAILNVPACNDWVRETGFHLDDGYEQPLDILMREDGAPRPIDGYLSVPPPSATADHEARVSRQMRERIDNLRRDQMDMIHRLEPIDPGPRTRPVGGSLREWTEDQLRPTPTPLNRLEPEHPDIRIQNMPPEMREAVRQQIELNIQQRGRIQDLERQLQHARSDISSTLQRQARRLDELERQDRTQWAEDWQLMEQRHVVTQNHIDHLTRRVHELTQIVSTLCTMYETSGEQPEPEQGPDSA